MALLNRAVSYAHRQRATVVVSAGNDTADLDHDGNAFKVFCSSPTVVCVAATGPTGSGSVNGPFIGVDTPAPYSNYGRSAISVAAPGGNQRPVWAACSRTSLVQPVCQTGNFVVGVSGTSQAAPHATGLAALLVEKIGKNPDRIWSLLQQSADDLGQPGTDPYYGKGRINVARALGLS
jgi:subtilisin family serine protease